MAACFNNNHFFRLENDGCLLRRAMHVVALVAPHEQHDPRLRLLVTLDEVRQYIHILKQIPAFIAHARSHKR